MTAPKDPARTVERSYEVRRKEAQEACRRVPCSSVSLIRAACFVHGRKKDEQ